jgi:hypothetical protein
MLNIKEGIFFFIILIIGNIVAAEMALDQAISQDF